MKFVFIDLSHKEEIKILHTRITTGVSVLAGYYMPLSEEDNPLRITKLKLEEEGLLEVPAIIIPSADLVEKSLFHLPKMPDKEINKVLPREIASLKDSNEPMAINFINNGFIDERQVEKLEIAAFFSPKQKIFEFLNQVKSEGITPIKIIPEVQGLKTLIEMNPQFRQEGKGMMLVELLGNRIGLNIFKNENWGLERYFLFRMDTEGELDDEDFSRISTELTRTLQYFKQRNRSVNIDRAIIYGSSSNIEHLKNLINDNLPLSAATINSEFLRDKVSFPKHLRDSQEFISIFSIPISCALSVANRKYLDLFPVEYLEKSRMPKRYIGFGIVIVIVGLILASGIFYFQNIKGSYQKDLIKIKNTFLTLSKNADLIAETKEYRADFFKRRYYLDFPINYSYAASNIIRKLSLITGDEVELIEMEINPGNQTLVFWLQGRITAENNIEAQSRFLAFYQKFKKFEEMIRIESSNVNVNPGETKPIRVKKGSAQKVQTEEKKVELFFTINGEADTESD